MLKREFKVNFKSFILWVLITVGIFFLVFLVYPSIIESGESKQVDEMMAMFPEELLKAFNMDLSSLDSAYGWLKSEGFVFVLLIIGCYAGTLGTSILLKEENDKTIEYLHSLPVTRNDIILAKVCVGVTYIILFVLLLGLFNYIGLTISGEFDVKQYILLSITPLFPALVIFFMCLALSSLVRKNNKIFAVGLAIVLISYILQTISTLADSVEFLKYFSVFTLADIRNVIVDISINPMMPLITLMLSIIFLIITIIMYNRKELV